MSWADTPIHFIDFEGNRVSGILEFGVVTLREGEIVSARTRLCAARGRIAPADIAVHSLDEARVASASPFAEEWEYFAGLRSAGPFAAHFASAENHLIKSVWPYGRQAVDYSHPGRQTNEWGPWIDTGRLLPQMFAGLPETKLERLVVQFGLQEELTRQAALHCPAGRRQYHAALYDALAGALLLRHALQRPEFASATLPWLLQMSTLDPDRRGSMQQSDLF